jgi:hypothetical protein
MRAPVALPAGISIRQDESRNAFAFNSQPTGIHIARRWLRGKHFLLLVLFWALAAGVGYAVYQYGWNVATVIGTVIAVKLNFMLLTMFLNSTRIYAGSGEVRVTHGPIPSLFGRRVHFPVGQLKQLYAAKHGAYYAVKADLVDGATQVLVAPLVAPEQALFVEQQIERALGLSDFEVQGELGSSLPQLFADASGRSPTRAATGAVLLGVLMPLLIGGALVVLVLAMTETEVTGQFTLTSSGKADAFVFVPSDCSSGQLSGFLGVDLTNKVAGQALRVVSDPIQGPVLILQRGLGDTQKVALGSCKTLDVTARHTNTTINDVRVIEGHANVDCEHAQANLTFAGCH